MSFSFGSPTDLHNQVANEIAASALAISGGDQTTILSYLPTGATWPTFTQLNSAENAVRTLQDAAMNTSRATGNNSTVAATEKAWRSLCGFRNIFDVAREHITRIAVPTS